MFVAVMGAIWSRCGLEPGKYGLSLVGLQSRKGENPEVTVLAVTSGLVNSLSIRKDREA